MFEELTVVSIESIRSGKSQPRKNFNEENLKELKDSIAEIGLIHPPVVRKEKEGLFELISGERRFLACQLLGKKDIPVIIREYDDKTAALGSLVENIQRVDLNPMEVAFGIKNLIDDFGVSQSEVSTKIGKERSTISNYLRLLQLPISIQKSLQTFKISMGHAKAILSLTDDYDRLLLHELILKEHLSVREAEAKVNSLSKHKEKKIPLKQRDFHLEEIERKIQEKLGVRVAIEGSAKKGKISLNYFSLDDIDRILNVLGIESEL